MRSTGEVMGIDTSFGLAYAKAQMAAGQTLPLSGTVFLSVRNEDKQALLKPASLFHDMGFDIVATQGTSEFLLANGIPNRKVNKVREGRPHVVDLIINRGVDLVVNTTSNKKEIAESRSIRQTTLQFRVPYTTTIAAAKASALAIKAMIDGEIGVKTIQEYHEGI
jgi:carbamoyl-phosphate synthase large subunit